MKRIITLFLSVSLTFLPLAGDIIMRHDVAESEYLKLAEKYGGSAIKFNVGCGTLIRPNWILTAAHVANSERFGTEVTIRGISYTIKQTIIHPDHNPNRGIAHDIALVEIDGRVEDIPYAEPYQRSDEMGKEIIFAGTGWASTGDRGLEGTVNKDRRLRAAQNRIDGIRPDGFLRFTFDAPESGKALPLEGISGPGDSGGPALLFDGGKPYILGVSSHQDFNGNAVEGKYGALEFYTRVSVYYDWIMEKTGG